MTTSYELTSQRAAFDQLVIKIDAILPQTQCGECGYRGCAPYANAIARGEAEINQCPPGGIAGVDELAHLLGRKPIPLRETPKIETIALIDENTCIGCTLCLQACPVDAIVGAAKQMHTVLKVYCTGCALCLPPCPVDCITLAARPNILTHWQWPHPEHL